MRLTTVGPRARSKRKKKRLGRGISAGQGASCGKGMRGQKSRSGPGVKSGFEGGQMPLYRRVPKLKHFSTIAHEGDYFILNLSDLQTLAFEPGDTVSRDILAGKGYTFGKKRGLKILGGGDLSVPLNVRASAFSRSAVEKIEAAGGTCVEI